MGTPGPAVGQCNGPRALGYKRARWVQGTETLEPPSTMTRSCRPSGPALASFLLTVLLGGEWSHVSIRLSLGIHSCFSTYALDSSGPLLTGRGGRGEEARFQRRRLRFRVVRGPGHPVGVGQWGGSGDSKAR